MLYANALRDDGVLVNAAWPGFVATDLTEGVSYAYISRLEANTRTPSTKAVLHYSVSPDSPTRSPDVESTPYS